MGCVLFAGLLLGPGLSSEARAWGGCEHERVLEETLDVAGSERLSIVAAAGDLDIEGEEGIEQVSVRARVCASKADWAAATSVQLEAGGEARLEVLMPEARQQFSWGDQYLYVDLEIVVPTGLALDIRDSSGDIDLSDVGAVTIKDSSGDIDIRTSGSVSLEDSSGDIELSDIRGDVTVVHDSSGDIEGRNISGNVVVAHDSSGDIQFQDVANDVLIERDSSGDIVAQGVGGDFVVLRDGSGGISHRDVQGSVQIPEDD